MPSLTWDCTHFLFAHLELPSFFLSSFQFLKKWVLLTSNLFLYHARESSLVSVGFLTLSFCRKCDIWNLCFDLGKHCGASLDCFLREKEICREGWKDKEGTCIHSPFPPCKKCRENPPYFYHHNKGFINQVFCRNWAVRNPAGTRPDSLAWKINKLVAKWFERWKHVVWVCRATWMVSQMLESNHGWITVCRSWWCK